MNTKIPQSIIGLLSEELPKFETHASIDSLFLYADAPSPIPDGSKPVKVKEWLFSVNKKSEYPLNVLGIIIEKYMDSLDEPSVYASDYEKEEYFNRTKFRETLISILERNGLKYFSGKVVQMSLSKVSTNLYDLIKDKNEDAIYLEFTRAIEGLENKPLESISAACNILESICKVYIEEEKLELPTKQDLRNLWKVVSKDLQFDVNRLQDDDLKKIISGLFSIVDGVSSLRTHGSSAHGQGKRLYIPESRHARLAVNSAHTLAAFVLETWNKRTL